MVLELASLLLLCLYDVSALVSVFTPIEAGLNVSGNRCFTLVALGFFLVAPYFNVTAALRTLDVFWQRSHELRDTRATSRVLFGHQWFFRFDVQVS